MEDDEIGRAHGIVSGIIGFLFMVFFLYYPQNWIVNWLLTFDIEFYIIGLLWWLVAFLLLPLGFFIVIISKRTDALVIFYLSRIVISLSIGLFFAGLFYIKPFIENIP